MVNALGMLMLFSLVAVVAAQDLAADTRALVAFRDVFDPTGRKLNWTNATSTCAWNGIVCTNNRVYQIRLPGQGLRGTIPPSSLSLLTELRVISLHNNHLTGPFPGEIGNCTRLRALYLGVNNFYGPVPDLSGFWPRLTHLSLEVNRSAELSSVHFVMIQVVSAPQNNASAGVTVAYMMMYVLV